MIRPIVDLLKFLGGREQESMVLVTWEMMLFLFIIFLFYCLFIYSREKFCLQQNINITQFSKSKTWKPQQRAGSTKTEYILVASSRSVKYSLTFRLYAKTLTQIWFMNPRFRKFFCRSNRSNLWLLLSYFAFEYA